MNWTETRETLIKINSDFISLPEEWRWRMDLRGADLRGGNLRDITMSWQSHALIAEHPDKAALWAGMNSDYLAAVRKDAGLIAEMQEAGE